MTNYIWGNEETQFFYSLTPELILQAVDSLGIQTTGRCLTLNSMENRVYEVEIDIDESKVHSESDKFVVAKFYRPGRWSYEQIMDEHNYLLELKDNELPAIAPLVLNGKSLFELEIDSKNKIYFCLFPKKGGRTLFEMSTEQIEIIGRLIARIHNIGKSQIAKHRITISPESFGMQNLSYLLNHRTLPTHYENIYKGLVEELVKIITPKFEKVQYHRVHGDCHWGNLIWRDEGPYFIDFDDMLMGPAVQDIWLIIPGTDQEAQIQRNILLEAYESMGSFDYKSLNLIEPLRTLRYIHFSAWIAKRWEDPAFKQSFPHFGTENYWAEQVSDLRNQINIIQNQNNPQYL